MQTNQTIEDRPERSAQRMALMQAARTVAERDGADGVTLTKVASEAGVPRATVYGQFARKEDLLMSIVSEDLASLARSMRGVDWPSHEGGDTPETAVVLPLPRAPDAAPEQTPRDEVEMAKDAAPAAPQADIVAAPRQRLARRADLAQVLDAQAGGDDGDAKESRTVEPSLPRAPDAWLERRLRVFERSMAAMESRQEQVEKEARATAGATEETVKALEATVRELKERADAAEAKAKASANEMRGALNEASLRLQTVEGVARAALAENHAEETPETATEVTGTPEMVDAQSEEPSPVPVQTAPVSDAPASFIAGVRKSVAAASAAAASAAAAAETATATEDKARNGRKSLMRYLLGGLAVLIIFVAAAGMAFSKGVSDGRRDALSRVAQVPAHRLAIVDAAQTPLDRLTARAQAGDAAAELHVGLRYLTVAPKDPAASFHWITLAAVHGQPVAQYLLGSLYAQGTGAPADAAKALQWYEAAALQGNRKAMHDLAIAYAQGLGTAKNPSEAVRWFSRAAGFGYVDSQFDLAVLYERGDGVPQSLLDAYKWYAVAGRQGDAESKLRVEALRSQLSADDLAAAQHAADMFRPLPYDVAANMVTGG